MRGWNIEATQVTVGKLVNEQLIELDAEPNFAEIGEKVRELTAELHEKILNNELKWSLMMTPMKLVRDLKTMCDGEIERREQEYKDMKDEMLE